MMVTVLSAKIARRNLLRGGAAVATGVLVDAVGVEPNWLEVTRHELAIEKLPRSLEGFTVAQISDAHLTRLGAVEEAIVSALRSLDVQLVVLTGDIIDSVERLGVLHELATELRIPGATTLAALGNWEHWGRIPIDALAAAYAEHDIALLVNDGLVLPDGLGVFATDDATAGRPRLERLREHAGAANLLITHSPMLLDRAQTRSNFSFALAGHTHGGQVRLGASAVPFRPYGSGRFVAGWYDVRGGPAYVSRGTGTSIVPARFTCRPELPVVRLRRG